MYIYTLCFCSVLFFGLASFNHNDLKIHPGCCEHCPCINSFSAEWYPVDGVAASWFCIL